VTYEQLMVELFQFSSPTYYKWKKHENRPIFNLLDYAFSKSDLEEYVKTGKISKLDSLENIIYTNHIRISEIIKLLSILDTDTLKNALIEALKEKDSYFQTVEYLNYKRTKLEIIKKIRNLLDDLHSEKQPNSRYVSGIPNLDKDNPKNQSWYELEQTLNDFNEKIGFDFNTEDRAIIDNIISRYRVYNTLYKLET